MIRPISFLSACLSLMVTVFTSMWLQKRFGRILRFALMFLGGGGVEEPSHVPWSSLHWALHWRMMVIILPYRYLGTSLEGSRIQITHHLIPNVMHVDLPTMLKGRLGERDRRLWSWEDPVQIPVCYLMPLRKVALLSRLSSCPWYTWQRTLVPDPNISPAPSGVRIPTIL